MAESPKRVSDSLAIPEADLGPAKKAKSSDNDDTPDVLAVATKGDVADLTSDDDADDDDDDSDEADDDGPNSSTNRLVKRMYDELSDGADSLVQCTNRRNDQQITRRNARIAIWEADKLMKSLLEFRQALEAEMHNNIAE